MQDRHKASKLYRFGVFQLLRQRLPAVRRKTEADPPEVACQIEKSRGPGESDYRDLVQNLNSIILRTDPEGNITFINQFAQDFFGWPQEEIIGKNLVGTIVPTEDRHGTDMDAFIGELCRDPLKFANNENENIRRNGERVWISWTNRPIVDGDGRLVEILCAGNDITERKKAEEELHQVKAELESMNEELVDMNTQLEHAVAIANTMATDAEIASMAKSHFLANMSHEIRTPMNGILGMTKLLKETQLTREQQDFADTVLLSAESLLMIINDILDFSKIEAGKLELEQIDFDLRQVVEEACGLVALKAQENGLQFVSFIDPEIPSVLKGDPVRIRQIVLNLAGNASKFTHSGGIFVRVFIESEDPDAVLIKVEVEDTGIGIPADRTPFLFQSFSQVDSSTTRQYGGTGLGLAISKELAEAMGGQIGVDSKMGTGSVFWFTARLEKSISPEVKKAPLPDDAGAARILVACTSPWVQSILERYLKAWACSYVISGDNSDAIERITRAAEAGEPYGTILIDHEPDRLDTAQLVEAARQALGRNRIRPIILLPATNRDAAVDLKVPYHVLTEPIRLSRLRACLVDPVPPVERPPLKNQYPQAGQGEAVSNEQSDLLRILVAEDNKINQKVVKNILKKMGYRPRIVSDGRQALEAVRSGPYDLVFMDVQMPVMDGLAATKAIRHWERNQKCDPKSGKPVPIVAMTANAMPEDRQQCLDSGMDDYLSKPIEPDALRRVIAIWGRGGGQAEAEPETDTVKTATDSPADQEPMDVDAALKRVMGDRSFLWEQVDLFRKSMPEELAALRSEAANGETESLARRAHALKGAAASLSIKSISELALEIETRGRNQDLTGLDSVLNRLETEFAQLDHFAATQLSG
jgi:two-component system sensor histidine kinase/response regulator